MKVSFEEVAEVCKGRSLRISAAGDAAVSAIQREGGSMTAFGKLTLKPRNCGTDGFALSDDDRFG